MSELGFNVPPTTRSSERPEKREIDLAIHGLVVYYTTAAPMLSGIFIINPA